VVNRPQLRHAFLPALELTDGDIVRIAIMSVEPAQVHIMRVMNCVDERGVDEMRMRQTKHIIDMDDVAGQGGIPDRPRGMVDLLQMVGKLVLNRPLALIGHWPSG
jgi:hypothetical protein